MSARLAYSLEQAAEATGLSADTIRRAIHSERHKLKAKRSGVDKHGLPAGKYVILHADLMEWLEGLEAA